VLQAIQLACALALLLSTAWPAPAAERTPRELYNALNALRVEADRTYYVRELNLRRDVVRLSFTEGKLAFLTALDGRVSGAVFTGAGRVLAIPRDPIEKRSLARFLGPPLLDQIFYRAYLRFTDDTAAEIARQLEQAGVQPTSEPSFGEEWNATVANLNPWHSLRVMADWLASDPQPYFYAGLIGADSGPFDVLVDTRREEHVLLGQPKWVEGIRFYDVWASFPQGNAPAFALPIVPLAYRVDTAIGEDHSLDGSTLLELRARRGGERMIALELSRYLKVQSVTDDAGQPLPFFQNEEVTRQQIAQRGNDSLFVIRGEPTRADETFRLRIAYRGSVISDAGNGVFFVGERGSWYPHVAGPDLFVPFELTFKWPRKLELVANGTKLEQREEGEWRSARFKSEGPIPVAGFNLGEYAHEQITAGKVKLDLYANNNLEAAVLRRFVRTPPPEPPRSPIAPPASRFPPQPRLNLPEPPPPSPAAALKELGQEVLDAIRFNEKLSGPFPFERLAIAQIPGAFGQSWPGLLYLSTLSYLPPAAQRRAGISQQTLEHFTELVPIHEVAHQWWGNLVGWASYRDQWLHEGLAHYLALLYADSKKPEDKVLNEWLEIYRRDLLSEERGNDTIVDEAGPLVLGSRLRSSKSPRAYTQITYGKGAWVFHMLRMMLHEPKAKDPDARFAKLLSSMLEAHRLRSISTDDLRRAVEKVMTPAMDLEGGRSMEWFFEQWVRSTGIPRYQVSFTAKPQQGGGFLVRGTLKQSGVPESFLASVPVYATGASGRPVLLGHVVTSGAETPFRFATRFAPRKLLLDPQMTLLAHIE
jgi:hypothetical protein